MKEDQIVHLLHSQQQDVIGYLYDNYGPALYGVAFRIVHSRELAEQVLQDAFLKIWRYGAQYDISKGKLFTWMLNITRNTAIDATRTNYYQFYSKSEDLTSLQKMESGSSIQTDHIGLREVVNNLEEKYRILIEKIYFDGYTQQEVQEELGIPIGTIKTRLRAAMEQLRRQFGGPETLSLIAFIENYLAS
jgi:RNA polymerase sigma-70 factor (ECF subfamily)